MVVKIISAALLLMGLLIGGFIAATWAPERSVADLRARWAFPPSTFVDLNGMSVHLRDEGPREDSRPIVLLHGMGASLYAWEGWAAALKEKRRVIRFDLPGFGLTGPSPDGIYGGARDVQMVIALLDKLGIQRCVLGGNSLGGAVSLRTALAYPSRVEKLILVDSGGYPSSPISEPIGVRLVQTPGARWLLQHTLPRSLVEQGYRNIFGNPDRVTAEMVDRAVALTQREGNLGALIERFRQRKSGDLASRIRELQLPTLIIWGGRDRLISPENGERFHREIAGSELVIFDDLGHAPEEEDPVRTVVAVRRFLKLD